MIAEVLRHSAIYVVPTVLARGIGLLLLPVYTRFLTPADYGIVEILATTFSLLNLLIPLEVSQAVARFSYDTRSAEQKSRYFSTAFWFTGLVFSFWLAIATVAPQSIARGLFADPTGDEIVQLAGLAFLVNALLYLSLSQLRTNMQSSSYATVSAAFAISSAGVSITTVVFFGWGPLGVVCGQLVGSTVGLAIALVALSHGTPLRMLASFTDLRTLLSYSAPLVVSALAVYVSLYADRWILRNWLGMAGLGVYSVALRLGAVITIATGAVQLALTPLIYRDHARRETPVAIEALFQRYSLVMASVVVVLSVFAVEIVGIVAGPSFRDAALAVPGVALAAFFSGLYVFAPGLSLAKRTKHIAVINVCGACANVIVSLLLVSRFAVSGVAFGAAAGAVVTALLYFISSQKYYTVLPQYRRYVAAVGVLALTLSVTIAGPLSVGQKAALIAGAVALLAVTLLGMPKWRAHTSRA